jgi:hypothetical protein
MSSINGSKLELNEECDDSWENISSGKNESVWYANIEATLKSNRLMDDFLSSSEGPVDVVVIGSRFFPLGNAINGPANTTLEHKQGQ